MTRSRTARWAISLLTPLAAMALAATPAAAATDDEPAFGSYVALGDSYAAGPLIPLQIGLPPGCLRSNQNYPSKVARVLGITDFRDVSCSGATTDDLVGSQSVSLGVNAPQLDTLGPDTALVTMTMGGNDIGFASIIEECAKRSPLHPLGTACKDFYPSGGSDPLSARVDATAPKIAAALGAIEKRSPHAKVVLVGYPTILPDTGPGCFPVVPFSAGDVAYLRGVEKELNAMLAEQADEAGVQYVDTYAPTVGHDVCTLPGTKWIEGLVPTSPAAPVHPNELGMTAIAKAVTTDLALSR
ncbi:SGNH/GDSL hydrolase family protein [Pseudonocardia sp.]|uniref:SGNH/GDSL hydrolase family protein n=1 Tax=Pseudonocardia sp. TaxID=60912 RepID=UPI002619FAD8|nr:SGNH/GDSL hydrolase family protein [Pseudonocardia sp.]MCW2717710.1 lipolytic protein family [Pseudonocardia sp.]